MAIQTFFLHRHEDLAKYTEFQKQLTLFLSSRNFLVLLLFNSRTRLKQQRQKLYDINNDDDSRNNQRSDTEHVRPTSPSLPCFWCSCPGLWLCCFPSTSWPGWHASLCSACNCETHNEVHFTARYLMTTSTYPPENPSGLVHTYVGIFKKSIFFYRFFGKLVQGEDLQKTLFNCLCVYRKQEFSGLSLLFDDIFCVHKQTAKRNTTRIALVSTFRAELFTRVRINVHLFSLYTEGEEEAFCYV